MKYKEIVKIIKNISFALPDVQSFYIVDVYEVNADQTVKYSSVVLTNQEHSFDNVNDRFQYNFILFYGKYNTISPSVKYIDFSLAKDFLYSLK